jgi:hypothetical protein
MRSVTYSMGVSLDGYIVGPDGGFDWTAPDEEVFPLPRGALSVGWRSSSARSDSANGWPQTTPRRTTEPVAANRAGNSSGRCPSENRGDSSCPDGRALTDVRACGEERVPAPCRGRHRLSPLVHGGWRDVGCGRVRT